MKIYLDTCCYNRPFDDKIQIKIQLETFAKLHIQQSIRDGKYDLVWSYILDLENSFNPFKDVRNNIQKWKKIATEFCNYAYIIVERAKEFENLGIKEKDSLHISCAIYSNCSFFITTDYKLTNKKVDGICILNPIDFINKMEE